MYAGVVAGVCGSFLIDWNQLSLLQWVVLHLAAVAPTAMQPSTRTRKYKIVSRLLLGACVGSYLLSGMVLFTPGHFASVFRPAVVTAFLLGYALLTAQRERNRDDPCRACPLGVFPTCEWNRARTG
jgi:hypothetical protein